MREREEVSHLEERKRKEKSSKVEEKEEEEEEEEGNGKKKEPRGKLFYFVKKMEPFCFFNLIVSK